MAEGIESVFADLFDGETAEDAAVREALDVPGRIALAQRIAGRLGANLALDGTRVSVLGYKARLALLWAGLEVEPGGALDAVGRETGRVRKRVPEGDRYEYRGIWPGGGEQHAAEIGDDYESVPVPVLD